MNRTQSRVRPAIRKARQRAVNTRRVSMARIAARVDSGAIRRANYVHEGDLTRDQRDAIGTALEDFLLNTMTGEVEYDHDVGVAYHAGFYLSAAWLIFSGTEAPELAAVFEALRVEIHPDWWIEDGWGAYHSKYGVQCPDCGSYSYGRPAHNDTLAGATWPTACTGCNATLPVRHYTEVIGSAEKSWAECCCGWSTDNAMTERAAKGQATRHVRAKQANAA